MNIDCKQCGACCSGYDVLLDPDEVRYFKTHPHLIALTRQHPRTAAEPFVLMKQSGPDNRCLALDGELGACACCIYPDRPQLCRDLEPGSDHCLEARRRAGLETPDPTPPA